MCHSEFGGFARRQSEVRGVHGGGEYGHRRPCGFVHPSIEIDFPDQARDDDVLE